MKRRKKVQESEISVLPAPGNFEDPLEALLDEESDEEFGQVILRDGPVSEKAGKPVRLAEWTAQDFSSIYLRFRPHLERHARRFLRNPSQVDEVVQDAFLYLMVSLPELDSEIGVLRFLKWKTRLLALDVIRASGRAYINSIDDVPEPESSDPEVSSYLEQQDDAAVVKLALSKLNPRHREVLIASMYEEKSTDQIAQQVGLSENATRQLIFRARAAFKNALIGDVDTAGMSAAAILSVAARKAAADSKKIGASAMALVALVALAFNFWPSLNPNKAEDSNTALQSPSEVNRPDTSNPSNPPIGSSDASGNEASDTESSSAGKVEGESNSGENSANQEIDTSPNSSSATVMPTPASGELTNTKEEALAGLLESAGNSTIAMKSKNSFLAVLDQFVTVGFDVTVDKRIAQIAAVDVIFTLDNKPFSVELGSIEQLVDTQTPGIQRLTFFANLSALKDSSGKSWSSDQLPSSVLKVEILYATDLEIIQSAFIGFVSR